jgi:hypothetical protein
MVSQIAGESFDYILSPQLNAVEKYLDHTNSVRCERLPEAVTRKKNLSLS